ncbi:MAG TPA: cupin domain-containing protein [Croceibacterium sp.]
MSPAKTLIEELRLSPHPEGGWFRETWRAPAEDGERGFATAIYFLLEAHQRSHWHKVDAAEIWLWHAGDPLLLSLSTSPKGPVRDVRLGPDVIAGDHPHYVIGAHEWQAASALPGTHGYTLVSCVVAPAFQFAGFTLAPPDWRPGKEQDIAAKG